ncbi:hypothetical protein [Ulvibacterium sp.]|uniref:hypothetical protein n=1 Tax=Ulvibacterium sp. TaxID=2665914 RepID=UPI0026124E0C|nr:hypothetical protein [Ulvibacterium sp.]
MQVWYRKGFFNRIRKSDEDIKGKNILVTGHFSLESMVEYGGCFPLKRHLSPPVAASFKVAFHQNIETAEDISNERFDSIRSSIRDIIKRKAFTIYADGHGRNLQILGTSDNFAINVLTLLRVKVLDILLGIVSAFKYLQLELFT